MATHAHGPDYTYLPIAGVDPNPSVPPTPEQREKERAILQKYFGYDLKKTLKDHPTRLPTMLPERLPWSVHGSIPRGLEVPKTAKKVKGYRQFVVTASLSPSYHNGSYSLNVVMQINQKSIYVGSIAVLGRGKSASCGNCQARRVANTRVRGVLLVPHEHVVGVIEASPIEAPVPQGSGSAGAEAAAVHGPANRLIQNLRTSLNCHVVLPSGRVYSRLSKEGLSDEGGDPNDTVPEVHLLSCDVYQDGDEDAPYCFSNWLDHGLPHGKWAKVQV
ncbi:hypothetical protein FRC10_006407 [Ceratobasidium sp. 414]|nr:hypothetical protein FRC10_006407 [Ceratobasidium sp. 414]